MRSDLRGARSEAAQGASRRCAAHGGPVETSGAAATRLLEQAAMGMLTQELRRGVHEARAAHVPRGRALRRVCRPSPSAAVDARARRQRGGEEHRHARRRGASSLAPRGARASAAGRPVPRERPRPLSMTASELELTRRADKRRAADAAPKLQSVAPPDWALRFRDVFRLGHADVRQPIRRKDFLSEDGLVGRMLLRPSRAPTSRRWQGGGGPAKARLREAETAGKRSDGLGRSASNHYRRSATPPKRRSLRGVGSRSMHGSARWRSRIAEPRRGIARRCEGGGSGSRSASRVLRCTRSSSGMRRACVGAGEGGPRSRARRGRTPS